MTDARQQMYCTVNNLEKGRLGERIVSEALARLPSGYRHFENLILPVRIGSRETTQLDHVVASEFGCFVVETKKFEGRIVGGEQDFQWVQCLGGRRFAFRNPIRQNRYHITILRRHLGLSLDQYHSVVVFVGLATLVTPGLPAGVLSTIAVGVPGFRRHIESFTQPLISPRQLNFMLEKLKQLKQSELTLADHLGSLRSRDLQRRVTRMLHFSRQLSRPSPHCIVGRLDTDPQQT